MSRVAEATLGALSPQTARAADPGCGRTQNRKVALATVRVVRSEPQQKQIRRPAEMHPHEEGNSLESREEVPEKARDGSIQATPPDRGHCGHAHKGSHHRAAIGSPRKQDLGAWGARRSHRG